ncbi:MAG: hypothetical protein ACPLPT_00010 [Moorellales bacterium]
MTGDFWLGVNYWPAESGVHWWEEFRLEEVARDFALIRGLGLNVVRIFLRWSDFQPAPDRIDEVALDRFEKVAEVARRNRLRLLPTLFTGHMSGENWDLSWRRDRCPYTDSDLLRAQLRLVSELAGRYGRHPSVAAWDLANEHDNFAPLPSSSAGYIWAHLLTRELQHYARQPVLLGTHVTSFTERASFRYSDLGAVHEQLCVHPYPMYSPLCPGRPSLPPSTLFPSFCLKLARALGGRPALLEEFGLSTTVVEEDEARAYYQTVLYSALAAGCTGALAWCFADFETVNRPPYATVPHEVGFGLFRRGRPKETGAVMAEFASAVSRLPLSSLAPTQAPAAVLLPARYYDHPEIPPSRLFALLFATYLSAKRAGLDVEFVSPDASLEGYRLLICPSLPRRGSLDLPHWEKLADFVRGGGSLYLSYGGVALPGLEAVFGVRLLYPKRAGVAGPDDADWTRTRLVVRPETARVVQWADGHPLVLEHRYGAGYTVLVTEPWEARLAASPWELADNPPFWLYRRAGAAAGLDYRLWGAHDPRNETERRLPPPEPGPEQPPPAEGEAKILGSTYAPERKPWLLLVSHSHRPSVWPNPNRGRWQDSETGEVFDGPIPLAPHQGRILREQGAD